MFDINEFADRLNSGVDFGVSGAERVARGLRKFADLVEQGRLVIQGVELNAHASADDYLFRELILSYIEMDGPKLKEVN